MTVSSSVSAGIYPTPEFKNIIQSLHELKREVSRIGRTHPDRIGYNRLIKNVDSLEESLREHYKELNTIEKTLATASNRKLTEKQRIMLQVISESKDSIVYTTLIDRISEQLGIPKSTVRWNMRGLREAGLIRAGDRDNKGIPVDLTDMGRIMMGVVASGY